MRIVMAASVLLAAAGCGCSSRSTTPGDAALPSDDMSDLSAPADLAPPSPDLSPPGPAQAYNFRIDAAHTGAQPSEALAPPLERAWSVDVGAHATYALVARGRVFAAGGGGGPGKVQGNLVAVDTQSGEVLWGPLALGASLMIAYDDGRLFVTVDQQTLLALDETTGETIWTATMVYYDESPPVTANGLVYLNSDAGNLMYAFDQKTGALVWRADFINGSVGAPAVANGLVYQSTSCFTHALDALSGKTAWTDTVGCTGGTSSMATVFDGLVYVRSPLEVNYVVLSGDHGQLRGTFNTDAPMAFADGSAYSLLGGTLRALDVATLSTRWSFRGDGHLATSPLVAGSYAYIASSTGMIYALDANGHAAWSADSGAPIRDDVEHLSLAAGEATLLVPVGNHIVAYRHSDAGPDMAPPPPDMTPPADMTPPPDMAAPKSTSTTQAPSFRVDTGHTGGQPSETMTPPLQQVWSYDAGDAISYPLVAGGRVFISTKSGLTTALDTQSGTVVWGPQTLGSAMQLTYDRGRLFGSNNGDVVQALDAATGAHLWALRLSQFYSYAPPVAAGGLVYVNGEASGGDTYAVDELTGLIAWDDHTVDGSNGAVAVADNVVYAADGCLQVRAWAANSGASKWTHNPGCTGGASTTPAVYQGRLYVRTTTGSIFDANSDTILGSFSTTRAPAFANGNGYYLQGTSLVAIPVAGSATSWTFAGDGALSTAPVAAGTFVYVGSTLGNVYAVDGTGHQVWTTQLPVAVSSAEGNSMAVAEGTLLVPAGNVLYAFRAVAP